MRPSFIIAALAAALGVSAAPYPTGTGMQPTGTSPSKYARYARGMSGSAPVPTAPVPTAPSGTKVARYVQATGTRPQPSASGMPKAAFRLFEDNGPSNWTAPTEVSDLRIKPVDAEGRPVEHVQQRARLLATGTAPAPAPTGSSSSGTVAQRLRARATGTVPPPASSSGVMPRLRARATGSVQPPSPTGTSGALRQRAAS